MRLVARRPSIRLARWAGGRPGQVEQVRPVDHQGRRDRAEAEQVGEERHRLGLAVDLVTLADLAVPVAVGGVGELERDPGRARVGAVVPGPAGQQLGGQLGPGQPGQEVGEQDPLVVPGGGPAGLGEQLRLGHPVVAQPVDQRVVEPEHGHMQLAHQQVDVVAGVAEQGDALGVAGQVGRPAGVVAADQELGGVVAVIQERHADRAVAVDDLQVGPGAAGVADLGQLGAVGQRRPVGGQVMGHELPEHRPAGSPLGVLSRSEFGGRRGRVAGATGAPEGMEGVVLAVEGVQLGEQPPVAAGRRRVHRPGRGQAVVPDPGRRRHRRLPSPRS